MGADLNTSIELLINNCCVAMRYNTKICNHTLAGGFDWLNKRHLIILKAACRARAIIRLGILASSLNWPSSLNWLSKLILLAPKTFSMIFR